MIKKQEGVITHIRNVFNRTNRSDVIAGIHVCQDLSEKIPTIEKSNDELER